MGNMLMRNKAKSVTQFLLGLDADGNPVILDLAEGPHMLVAGTTGSGKSVTVNEITVSMQYHSHPDELQFAMVDPKKVEFSIYEGSPFLMTAPITDMEDAYGLLAYVVEEAESRYELFQRVGVKKLSEYLDWYDADVERAKAGGFERLPYIVVIIDEWNDLRMVSPRVEDLVVRLCQKARAAGIHLIIATQRPSADVITGTIKANIPARLCMMVGSEMESRIVLDEQGGEKLSRGEMLVRFGTGPLLSAVCPYLSNDEVSAVVKHHIERFGPMREVDWKSRVVDAGACEWAEDYDDSVPVSERHVVAPKRRFGF